ncbi:MAG: hypothetical protein LUD19_03575 [Clostridia bacterium]|nr:hypothetical protein [Clostridia bacterium]
MKTDLTKTIEQAIIEWNPAQIGDVKVNQFRAHHTGLEVPAECGTTTGGIIDAVRVSEYFGDIKYRRICRPSGWRRNGGKQKINCPNRGKPTTARQLPHHCDNTGCMWNGVVKDGVPKILLTCFEIKVTKSDFKSDHGHNHVGNLNYYAVPEEIYKEIEPLVPKDIGILVYLHRGIYQGLRTKRRPTFKELTDEEQKWLLLSTFKRVRDMDYERYIKLIAEERRNNVWL